MLFSNPAWTCVSYLFGRARQRATSALDGNPESGALTLEWIVIAGILVVAAVAAGVVFSADIKTFEAKLK
jgi:hypothetical protein